MHKYIGYFYEGNLYLWSQIICEKNVKSTDHFLSLLLYGITLWYEPTRVFNHGTLKPLVQ